jgi:arylsulfatase
MGQRRTSVIAKAILWASVGTILSAATLICVPQARAADPKPARSKQPNIVVIFGDDIGMWNVGAYTHGMMGKTPNIDSIAKSGALFTDHYAQPSCTAGRAAFLKVAKSAS